MGFWSAFGAEMMKSPQQSAREAAARLHCPHCDTSGRITRRRVKVKNGISGGKATGAVLTGGVSILATGLSRKREVTEMRCSNCNTVWNVA